SPCAKIGESFPVGPGAFPRSPVSLTMRFILLAWGTMKIPAFKPSRKILDEYDVPCLVATVKNSKLPGVAARSRADSRDDCACRIYLRGKHSKAISAWQRGMLEQFFEKEQLAPIIANVMAGYEKKAGKQAYMFDEKERNDFEKHGIVPLMTLSTIVIDDIK